MAESPKSNTTELTADDTIERHEREKFAFDQMTAPEQARQQVRMRALYASDPWAFLSDCVYTLNQVADGEGSIALFPSHLKYVEFLAKLWLREKLLAIPKSRRMICSWTFISLYLQNTIFNPGRFNAFVSKKEDDSGELLQRAEFIYKKIPEWRIPRALLPALKNGKMSKQPPLMEFEDIHSKIQGFPQGADQMRQFTLSGMLFDEWAFWDEAQASYSAAKPTLDGGGRLTGISSRSPGFFKKIVFDKLDATDLTFREVAPAPIMHPMEGVEVWRNPKNKFVVVDLHYTANPEKRGEQWKNAVRESMPIRDFLMEYEKSWQTFEGKPVYADFNKTIHVAKSELKPEPGIPLLIGVDFGLTPAFLIAQLIGRRLVIYKEFLEDSGSISKLAPVVWNYLQVNFLNWMHRQEDMVYLYIDPAGFQKAQTDERTCADVLRCAGDIKHPERRIGFKNIRPGPVGWESRRKAVEDFLTQTYGEGPGMLIDEGGCPILVEGFGGGYRYPEKATNIEPELIRPLKNKYSHPHDGCQYLCAGATQLRKSYGFTDIPIPSYGFQTSPQQHQQENKQWKEKLANSTKLTPSNG